MLQEENVCQTCIKGLDTDALWLDLNLTTFFCSALYSSSLILNITTAVKLNTSHHQMSCLSSRLTTHNGCSNDPKSQRLQFALASCCQTTLCPVKYCDGIYLLQTIVTLSGVYTSTKAQQFALYSLIDTSHLITLIFFIDVHALIPEKLPKNVKNALFCNVKESDRTFQILAESILGRDHPSSRFHGNPFSGFCVILLTAVKQTQVNTTSLAEVIMDKADLHGIKITDKLCNYSKLIEVPR